MHDHVREQPHVGDIEDAVVRRAVGAGEAGAVEAKTTGRFCRATSWKIWSKLRCRNVRVDVARSAACPALAMPGGEGDGVRFADADVEEAVGKSVADLLQLVPLAHGRGHDRDLAGRPASPRGSPR